MFRSRFRSDFVEKHRRGDAKKTRAVLSCLQKSRFQVVLVLRKEVSNTTNEAGQRDDVGSYRQVRKRTRKELVRSLYSPFFSRSSWFVLFTRAVSNFPTLRRRSYPCCWSFSATRTKMRRPTSSSSSGKRFRNRILYDRRSSIVFSTNFTESNRKGIV